jgi:hypothetical protein
MNKDNIKKIVEEFPDIRELWEVLSTSMIIGVVGDEIEDKDEWELYHAIERNVPEGKLIGLQTLKTMAYKRIKNDRDNKLLYSQEDKSQEDKSQEDKSQEDGIEEENYEQFDFDKTEEISEITSNVIIDYCKYNGINTTGYEGIVEALINERNKKADNYSLLEELMNQFCDRKLQVLSYKIFRHLSEEVAENMLHEYSGDNLISELTHYYWEHPDLFE